jgi:hypothetical protein
MTEHEKEEIIIRERQRCWNLVAEWDSLHGKWRGKSMHEFNIQEELLKAITRGDDSLKGKP